jgi:16S rRNA (cytosine967-C5)-methyltransferase
MPLSPARIAAFDILLRVARENAYADALLSSRRYTHLSSADHALTTELVMGSLRWQQSLDGEIGSAASKPLLKLDLEVLIALRLGAYQLRFLERVPPRAAVHESAGLVKRSGKTSAAAFVNAVLRKLASAPGANSRELLSGDPRSMAEVFSHPSWLVGRWCERYGWEHAAATCAYDQQVPPTAIRVPSSEIKAELDSSGVNTSAGRLLSTAARVESRGLTRTRVFSEGRVAIQDEGSQLVAALVGKGDRILDCCAAPGGKARALADRNVGAVVYAADLHPHRAKLMRKLIPSNQVTVITADALHLPFVRRFDRVLADVPCSGTGTLARNPEIKWRLKPEDLPELQGRQIAILKSAFEHVDKGGWAIYSTCSLESEENEDVVKAALASRSDFRLLDCSQELARLQASGELTWEHPESLLSGPYLRTIPGVHPCDGFFAAILRRE